MIVAVTLMDVVAVPVDDVVDVVTVLHRRVSAFRTVDVLRIVTLANVTAGGVAHTLFYGPG